MSERWYENTEGARERERREREMKTWERGKEINERERKSEMGD